MHAPDEYLHVFDRGMQKQPIFKIEADYLRFIFIILTFQGEHVVKNISREIKQTVQSSTLHSFGIEEDLEKDILKNRMVELVAFSLMPNHFHLLVRELVDNGLSKYMQRVMTAYTKYFNLRHTRSGHLFQSRYKSVLINSDKQLMHVSAYIHKNPAEIGWRGKEEKYPWCSYQDYLGENRFRNLLVTDVVMERFRDEKRSSYKEFVSSSPAKEITEELFGPII